MKQTTHGGHTLCAPGYDSLSNVLCRAFIQASQGKGKDRHANELPFDQQPMQTICGQFGVGFALGQATKKAEESQGLPHDAAVAELLGAINYLAGAVIFLEGKQAAQADAEAPSKPHDSTSWKIKDADEVFGGLKFRVDSNLKPGEIAIFTPGAGLSFVKHPVGCKCGDTRECLTVG